MSQSKRRCLDGGYLVDGRHPVPEDPIALHDDSRRPVVGCNRLRCLRCNEIVQQQPQGSTRRYLCSCHGWLECDVRPTSGRRGSRGPTVPTVDDAEVPWRCAGHPSSTRQILVSQ